MILNLDDHVVIDRINVVSIRKKNEKKWIGPHKVKHNENKNYNTFGAATKPNQAKNRISRIKINTTKKILFFKLVLIVYLYLFWWHVSMSTERFLLYDAD